MSTWLRLACLVCALATVSACTFHAHGRSTLRVRYQRPEPVVVTEKPPAPRPPVAAQDRPPKPGDEAVWIPGHWVWRGEWVWRDGRWHAPQPGYTWQPPVVVRLEGRMRYCPGYWRPSDEEPPPAYRSPERVRVSSGTTEDDGPERARVGDTQDRSDDRREQDDEASQDRAARTRAERVRTEIGSSLRDRGADDEAPGGEQRDRDASGTDRVGEAVGRHIDDTSKDGEEADTRGPAADAARRAARERAQSPGRIEVKGAQATKEGELRCKLAVASAPAGSVITIRGENWGDSPIVKVGGQVIPIVRKQDNRIRARLPHGMHEGGDVYIERGNGNGQDDGEQDEDEREKCGSLEILPGGQTH